MTTHCLMLRTAQAAPAGNQQKAFQKTHQGGALTQFGTTSQMPRQTDKSIQFHCSSRRALQRTRGASAPRPFETCGRTRHRRARARIPARDPRACPAHARPGPASPPPPQRSPSQGDPDHLSDLTAAAAQRREAAAGALDRAAQAPARQRAVHGAGELLGRRVMAPGHILARCGRRVSRRANPKPAQP